MRAMRWMGGCVAGGLAVVCAVVSEAQQPGGPAGAADVAPQGTFASVQEAYTAYTNSAGADSAKKNAIEQYIRRAAESEGASLMQRSDACRIAAEVMMKKGQYEDALRYYAACAKLTPEDRQAALANECFSRVVEAARALDNPEKADAAFKQMIADFGGLTADSRMKLARSYGLFLQQTGRPQDVIPVLEQAIKDLPAAPTATKTDLLQMGIGICRAALANHKRAEPFYRQMIDMKDGLDAATLCGAYLGLAQMHIEAKEGEKAVPPLLSCLGFKGAADAAVAQAANLLLSTPATDQQVEEAANALRAKVAAAPLAPSADIYQATVGSLYFNRQKTPNALQEARIFFNTASDKSVQAAMDQVTAALKAEDLNLARVNRFLKYQRFGPAGEDKKPGTGDDLDDVLDTIPPINDPQRAAVYERALALLPRDWTGRMAASKLYLYMGRPVQALESLRSAFAMCPAGEKELQTVTDAITGLIIRLTKDVSAAEKFIQFTMFGPVGKDGKAGTADDIEDPVPEMVKRFSGMKI